MRILNFGSLNVDYVYQVDEFLQPGETKLADSRSVQPGGKGLNQSIALARAGAEVHHAGALGDDGALLQRTLEEAGVNTGSLRRLDAAGGHTVIQVNSKGENCILLYGGTNQMLTEEYVDDALSRFGSGDLLLLQNETNLIGYIMERAHQRGMKIAFNAAPMDERALAYPLGVVSWLIVNEIEGAALAGVEREQDVLRVLAEKYPHAAIVLTLGSRGCLYAKGDTAIEQPAHDVVRVVDTTAAGDVFVGYFLEAVMRGAPARDALQRASAASALAIQKPGAANSIPAAAEVERALQSGNIQL